MLTAALRLPAAKGVNVTLTWQLSLGARVALQVFFSTAKSLTSAPVIPMLDSVSGAPPVFVNVTVWAGLVVLIVCGPKVKLVGTREIAGKARRKMRVCHVWQLLAGTWQLLVPV
jgi:hypothetical protein